MSAWIILLFFLCNNNDGGFCRNMDCRSDNDCGCGRDRDRDRNRDRDCDGRERDGRERDRDCDCNESRFEPRFDTRPFNNKETCGCEENND